MTQSGHNFAHAMTVELSWHVQNCDLISYLFFMYDQEVFFQDYSHELVKPM